MKQLLMLGVFFVFIGLGTIVFLWERAREAGQFQDYENSPSAFVILSKGNSPMRIEARVLNPQGNPIRGATVQILNNSGHERETTDSTGRATIRVGERDVQQILLDGRVVLNRENSYLIGYPSAERGLHVLIVKKDLHGVSQSPMGK